MSFAQTTRRAVQRMIANHGNTSSAIHRVHAARRRLLDLRQCLAIARVAA